VGTRPQIRQHGNTLSTDREIRVTLRSGPESSAIAGRPATLRSSACNWTHANGTAQPIKTASSVQGFADNAADIITGAEDFPACYLGISGPLGSSTYRMRSSSLSTMSISRISLFRKTRAGGLSESAHADGFLPAVSRSGLGPGCALPSASCIMLWPNGHQCPGEARRLMALGKRISTSARRSARMSNLRCIATGQHHGPAVPINTRPVTVAD